MSRWIFLGGKANQNEDIPPYAEFIEIPFDAVPTPVYSVANLAELSELTDIIIGQKVRVESVGRSFEFTAPGVSPVQDAVVINGVGGQWHSLEGTSDQKWLNELNWYVDNIVGNDENIGTIIGSPLKTIDEIQRRWGPNPTLTVRVTITCINIPDIITLKANRASDSAGITLIGITVPLVTTTVGAYTVKNPAANIGYDLVCPDVADWTPYLGKRISIGNTSAWVCRINPGGLNHAGITPFFSDTGLSGSIVHPVVGQVLTIDNLPTCSSMYIELCNGRLNDAAIATFIAAIKVYNIGVGKQCTFRASAGILNVRIWGCDLVDLGLLPQGSSSYTITCRERYAHANIPQHTIKGVMFDRSLYSGNYQYRFASCDTWATQLSDCVIVNIGLQIASLSAIFLSNCAFFDWPSNATAAVDLSDGSSIIILSDFYGSSSNPNTYGLKVRPTTNVYYNSLNAFTAGVSGEITCTAIGSFLYSDRPLFWCKYQGTDVLAAGTKIVTRKNIPVGSKIWVTPNTPAGVVGRLSVPQATRVNFGTTTSQFTVNSDSGGDTSTFDWGYEFSGCRCTHCPERTGTGECRCCADRREEEKNPGPEPII